VLSRESPVAPLLVFAYGNPSRGDDALGPLFVERAAALASVRARAADIEFLMDFQLQVEHALDLVGRRAVLFVDASATGTEAAILAPARPARDASFSSHALSPAAVLQAYVDVFGDEPPPTQVLAIRGYEFELGQDLSPAAASALDAALLRFESWLAALSP
jgi:hydrogenase maturation protease